MARVAKSDEFDPYRKWLGIPPGRRPPTHYELLGISSHEDDGEVIQSAAERQSNYVRQYLGTVHDDLAKKILYQIEEAAFVLTHGELRQQYDESLPTKAKKKRRRSQKRALASAPSSSGATARQGYDLLPTYAGIVGILLVAFMLMAGFSFWLPWREVVFDEPDDKEVRPQQVAANQPPPVPAAPPSPNELKNNVEEQVEQIEPVGEVRAFRGHQKAVTSVAFSPDGKLVASGSEDRTVRLWDVKTGQTIWTASPFSADLLKVSFAPDGQGVLACDKKKLYVFESKMGKEVDGFEIGQSDSVDISRDGRFLLKTYQQGDLIVFDLKSKREFLRQQRRWGTATATFDPSGEHVIYGEYGLDRQNLSSRHIQNRIINQKGYFEGLAVSPDGSTLATGSGKLWEDNKNKLGNCLVRLWNLNNGSEITQFSEHRDWVRAVAFSPDGRFLLSGGGGIPSDWHGHRAGADCTLRLWDVEARKLIKDFDGHKAGILSVTFSPDGRYALTGSADKTVRLWKLPDETALTASRRPATPQRQVASPQKTTSSPPQPVQTVTYTFENQRSLAPFQCSGRYHIIRGGGLEFRKPSQGNAPLSKAVSRAEFTYPITARFDVYALSDATYDVFPGLFGSINYFWGTYYNTVTEIRVGPDKESIPHQKIKAGERYQIEMSIDKDRLLQISVNGNVIHKQIVDDKVKLQGPIILGGGIGHVVYKELQVSGRKLTEPPAPHERADQLQTQSPAPTKVPAIEAVGNYRLTLVNVRTNKTAHQTMELRADQTLGLDGGSDVRGTWSIKDNRLILEMPGLDIEPAQRLEDGRFSGTVIGPANVLRNIAGSSNRPAEKLQARFTLTKSN